MARFRDNYERDLESNIGGGNHRQEVWYGIGHGGRRESGASGEKLCDRSVMVGLWTPPSIPKLQCDKNVAIWAFMALKKAFCAKNLRFSLDKPLTYKTLVADSATPIKPRLQKRLLQRQLSKKETAIGSRKIAADTSGKKQLRRFMEE